MLITEAFSLSLLITIGAVFIYSNLPRRIRRFIRSQKLIMETLTFVGVYYLFGGFNIPAVITASLTSALIGSLIYISNNPDEFFYLYDLREIAIETVQNIKERMKTKDPEYITSIREVIASPFRRFTAAIEDSEE